MRNRVQNSTGKAERKIVGITTAENGRCFVDFYTKNPWSFVTLYSPTTLWKASEGLMWLWSSLAPIKFWAPSPDADKGVVGCLTAVRCALLSPILQSVLSSNWNAALGTRSRNSSAEGWRQRALKSFLSGDSVTKDNICLSCMFNLCLVIQRAGLGEGGRRCGITSKLVNKPIV